jgi:hypothetical protein
VIIPSHIGKKPRALALALPLAAGCAQTLEPGEYGTFRYAGVVKGQVPLKLLPPLSDRAGNAYVLYGALDELEVRLFVGHAGGGWSGGCEITAGTDFGVHGWVGRSERRAWYWSGDALVAASGLTGGCHRVLETDPASGAKLRFRAVVPWVRDRLTRTTTVAWIQSATDPVPYQVVVDLDNDVYLSLSEFEPRKAKNVQVLGVGGNLETGEGVIVARYELAESKLVEAFFVDAEGKRLATARLKGLDTLPEYGIVGTLQPRPEGLYAAVDVEGQLVLLERAGGGRRTVGGLVPVGVHEWEGKLFLVGDDDGTPRLLEIGANGALGGVERWDASVAARKNLGSEIEVLDDRTLPSHKVRWQGPRSAMGRAPFLHAHRLDHYADATTSWLVAGPDFEAGGVTFTAIAYAPVGVSYP